MNKRKITYKSKSPYRNPVISDFAFNKIKRISSRAAKRLSNTQAWLCLGYTYSLGEYVAQYYEAHPEVVSRLNIERYIKMRKSRRLRKLYAEDKR